MSRLIKFYGILLFFASYGSVKGQAPEYTFSNSPTKANSNAVQVSHPLFLDVAFSPGNKKIVFINYVSGYEQLFISDINFQNAKQVTFDPVHHEDPAWSPDGKWIAFVKVSTDSEIIFMMDTLGQNYTRVSPDGMKTIHPSWSADSQSLLFCSDDDLKPPKKNESNIYSKDLKTNTVRTIVSGGTNTFPVLSPDGKTLAFRKMVGEKNSEIFLADSDGKNEHNITNHPAFDGWPSWSPDGNWIAFASNRNSNYQETPRNTYQIFVMDKTGNNVSLVAETTRRGTAPKWSPDGKYIYMTNCVRSTDGTDCNIFSIKVVK